MAFASEYAHIYLSPHLDDAVLSCAGRMHRQARAGGRVAVVTVFAGSPDPSTSLSPYARELHARWGQPIDAVEQRRKEDREALALLGVDAVQWSYKDCIYRRTPEGDYAYASEEALWGRLHPAETGLIRELKDRVADLPLALDGVLYVPLAVGHHVDHRIVRRAVEEGWWDLVYYEDYPYAEDVESLEATEVEGIWRAELVPLSDKDLEAKIEAIARYRSQVSSFWADRSEMEASVRAFVSRHGIEAPAERYWRPPSDT